MKKAILFIKVPNNNIYREDAMEKFLNGLHHLLPNGAPISLEMASFAQFLHFYITIDQQFKNIVQSQLYAQYPDAEIEDVNDFLPDSFENIAFAQIDFKNSSLKPFRTYQNLEESFLKLLSVVSSKTDINEKIFFQISLKRIGSKLFDRGFGGTYFNLFGKKYYGQTKTVEYQKFTQNLYSGKLRVAYLSKDKQTASQKLAILVNLIKSVKGSSNELRKKKFFAPKNMAYLFKSRAFTKGDYWSTSELATLYHFPHKGSLSSNIVQTTSKRAPSPDILPTLENTNPKDISIIGNTNYRNDNKIFGIKRIDRRRHMYIVGKTGSGKSKLLELLLISDIQNGQGCCLLDPHGDLATEVLKYIPKERIDDVVYVDPTDRNFPVGFNPLEPVADYESRQQISTFFISIFKKLFSATWNPRMEHLIRHIILALLETPDSNVLGIARMLSDTAFRQRVIKQIQDPVVKAFWANEFTPSDNLFSSEAIIPILNKVGQFISNPIVRNIVGQKKNVLDFGKFMNEGKIVIINLSKGSLGDENTALLGSMFITKIQQAALSRAKIPEEQRRDFYFYIDEFQNFATDAFSSILSEARKYHLNLTIAHQYIAQLPEDIRATAFGNVGSLITFAIGAEDASYLAKELAPTFSANDMVSLNSREMYIKMSIDGKLTLPFSAHTLTIPNPTFDYTQQIIDKSRITYAQNKTIVENDIALWTQNNLAVSVLSKDEEFPQPII